MGYGQTFRLPKRAPEVHPLANHINLELISLYRTLTVFHGGNDIPQPSANFAA
ncbi:Hypothetical protein KLENKIAIHU_3831 [Klenkia terrae]|nr:Hypothetical protein KLENKIAIHU_3831 [Klenkia terrae]